jgi:uncharacterized protein
LLAYVRRRIVEFDDAARFLDDLLELLAIILIVAIQVDPADQGEPFLWILTEAAWLRRTRPRSLNQLFGSFDGGLFAFLTLDAKDLPTVTSIMKRYEDSGIQFADAALAHLAERENTRTVFTTNRRDFSIFRLKRNRTLKLLPEVQRATSSPCPPARSRHSSSARQPTSASR